MTIVVHSIQRCAVRTLAHVGEEVLERFEPAGADLDATSAIPLEVSYLRIRTAPLHLLPDRVRRPAPAIRKARHAMRTFRHRWKSYHITATQISSVSDRRPPTRVH